MPNVSRCSRLGKPPSRARTSVLLALAALPPTHRWFFVPLLHAAAQTRGPPIPPSSNSSPSSSRSSPTHLRLSHRRMLISSTAPVPSSAHGTPPPLTAGFDTLQGPRLRAALASLDSFSAEAVLSQPCCCFEPRPPLFPSTTPLTTRHAPRAD